MPGINVSIERKRPFLPILESCRLIIDIVPRGTRLSLDKMVATDGVVLAWTPIWSFIHRRDPQEPLLIILRGGGKFEEALVGALCSVVVAAVDSSVTATG